MRLGVRAAGGPCCCAAALAPPLELTGSLRIAEGEAVAPGCSLLDKGAGWVGEGAGGSSSAAKPTPPPSLLLLLLLLLRPGRPCSLLMGPTDSPWDRVLLLLLLLLLLL